MVRKILIVDDEKGMLDSLNKKLTADGYNVGVETTARGGLRRVRSFVPDIIFLDILLPDMEGPEVAQLLQHDPKLNTIPVVFLSGIVTNELGGPQAEVKVGGWTYRALGKPFTYGEILKEIEYVIGSIESEGSGLENEQ